MWKIKSQKNPSIWKIIKGTNVKITKEEVKNIFKRKHTYKNEYKWKYRKTYEITIITKDKFFNTKARKYQSIKNKSITYLCPKD